LFHRNDPKLVKLTDFESDIVYKGQFAGLCNEKYGFGEELYPDGTRYQGFFWKN